MPSILQTVPLILNSGFLSLSEVSRLCQASKDMKMIIQQEEHYFWKQRFEEIVEVGISYYKNSGDCIEEGKEALMYNCSRRSREMSPAYYKVDPVHNGLLPCFSTKIHPTIIEHVGYYQMVTCFMSKTCSVCGMMGNYANPLTFRRYCRHICSKSDEESSSYFLDKNTAMKEFSVSEQQLYNRGIPKISGLMSKIVSSSSDNSITDEDSATLLSRDMTEAVAAIECDDKRIKHKESVSNDGSNRYCNNDGYRYIIENTQDKTVKGPHQQCYPIGVQISFNTSSIKLTHALKCNKNGCNVSGCLNDIMRHERLQHNDMYAHPQNYDFEVIHPEVQSLKYMNTSFYNKFIKYRKKLSYLVKGGLVKKSMGVSTKKLNGEAIIANNWIICFRNGCRLAIDLRSSLCNSEDKETYDIDMLFQSKDNHVPMQLLFLSFDAQDENNHKEIINDKGLVFAQEKLGLYSESELIELIAVLIERSIQKYTLELFSQIYLKVGQGFRGRHQNNILTKIFQRIYRIKLNHNDLDWNKVQSESMYLRKIFFKLQRSLNMYYVKRLVRRRSEY